MIAFVISRSFVPVLSNAIVKMLYVRDDVQQLKLQVQEVRHALKAIFGVAQQAAFGCRSARTQARLTNPSLSYKV